MSEAAANLVRQALRDRGDTFARQENELRQLYARLHTDLGEAVRLARASADQPVLVKALKALGQIERDAGHAQASLARYEEAVAICRDIGDPVALAHKEPLVRPAPLARSVQPAQLGPMVLRAYRACQGRKANSDPTAPTERMASKVPSA